MTRKGKFSSTLAWRIPGMGEPGGLLSMGSQRVRHNRINAAAAAVYINITSSSDILSVCMCWSFSHVQLFATPWTVAHQAPLSMGFSRKEYYSGLSFLIYTFSRIK